MYLLISINQSQLAFRYCQSLQCYAMTQFLLTHHYVLTTHIGQMVDCQHLMVKLNLDWTWEKMNLNLCLKIQQILTDSASILPPATIKGI